MTSLIRRAIARGYCPYEQPAVVVTFWDGAESPVDRDRLIERMVPSCRGGIGLVLPTFTSRMSRHEATQTVEALLAQLQEASARMPGLPLLFIVGLQWDEGQESETFDRLVAFAKQARGTSFVSFIGCALPRGSKVQTLNVAFQLARDLDLLAIGWVDDDVHLESECLALMFQRFLEKRRGALGAAKVPHARRHVASRLLKWAKDNARTSGRAYPHGCCMIVDMAVAARGIPSRYVCDDDYVCFTLLQPDNADPLANLEIVRGALCHHTVGGPAREIWPRLRRSLITSHVLQADFTGPVARYYFGSMQFFGLWPLTTFDLTRGFGRGTLKLVVKWIYFALYCVVGMELALRGLVGFPYRQIPWHGYSGRSVPPVLTPDAVPGPGPRTRLGRLLAGNPVQRSPQHDR